MIEKNLRVSPGKGLFLLVCWWILLTVAASFIMSAIGTETVTTLRWAIIIQDLAVFILPVELTMLLCSPKPSQYLGIDTSPRLTPTLWAAATAGFSIPAMNRIVAWNESIHLPSSWSGLEEVLRNSEDAAKAMTDRLMSGTSVWDLIVAILIMGVLTGFAEEMFFRGGLQRLMMSKFGNKHMAIWSAAFIFSAVHLQFFGFFPRLLMGAYFGYIYVWSGSLWLPIFAHALNNSLVVLNFWLINKGILSNNLNNLGSGDSALPIILTIISILFSTLSIYMIRFSSLHNKTR